MQVTTITVTRRRSVQPEQYGNTAAEVQVVANLDDGEAWQEKARDLLVSTRALVYENLGMKLPSKVAGDTEKAAATDTATVEVNKDAPTTESKSKSKRGPGRPRKDTSDLPGVVDDEPEPENSVDSEAPSEEVEVTTEVSPSLSNDELQQQIVAWIKKGLDIGVARKTMVDIAGVVKSSDVPEDKIMAVHDAIKAQYEGLTA